MIEEGAQPQAGPQATQEAPGKDQGNGQIDRPELGAKLQAKRQEKAVERAEGLSIAERLTRRTKTETINIPFEDDLGQFFIEVRLPTTAEMDSLISFEKKTKQAGQDPDSIKAASEELYKLLGDLAVDPSLDADFFKNGNFLASDLSQIIKEIMLEEEHRIKSVSSFRKNTVRAGTL